MPPSDSTQQSTDGSFVSSFITPLLKATKKGSKEILSFYTMAEFRAWRDSLSSTEAKRYSVKYFKGLGTSTSNEARDYFASFDKHMRPFRWNSEADGEALDMVFDKERAADRRRWIIDQYDEKVGIDGDIISFEEFINKEMIHFSHADNLRSLPSVIDGLKPSQRKVLYACFKRKLNTEMKVAQVRSIYRQSTLAVDCILNVIVLFALAVRLLRGTYSLPSRRSLTTVDEYVQWRYALFFSAENSPRYPIALRLQLSVWLRILSARTT